MVANTPQSRKQKGRKFQQDIRDDILVIFEGELTEDDVRSTSMGASGTDILLSQRAKELFPFAVECKRKEAINVPKDYEQAEVNADKEGTIALLVFKQNWKDALVTMEWEVFKQMVERLYTLEESKAFHLGLKPKTLSDLLLKK